MNKGVIKLKEFRYKKRLTQKQMAELAGVGRSLIALLESNKEYNVSVKNAKKLANVISINWKLFFEGE